MSKIIDEFKEIHNIKISFKKFALNISTSIENIHDYDSQETSENVDDESTNEKSDLLDKFDSDDLDLDNESHSEMNIKKYVNVELDDSFFKRLIENEQLYEGLFSEVKIPLNVYNNHFN